jgi:type VI secretion system VasD/TssJ family lipoprotein
MIRASQGGRVLRVFNGMRLALLALCALSAACGGTTAPARPPAPPPKSRPTCPVPGFAQLELEASDRVNLDENGRPLPTRLHIYQLSDISPLQNASFEDMWARSKATLADSALKSNEVIIYPGQVSVYRFKREAQADYIVGIAIFREPQGDAWRTIQEWPAEGDPCKEQDVTMPMPQKLRIRMFLEDSRIESVTNYANLPKRRCPRGQPCSNNATGGPELRRNRHLSTFEEDPREPEQGVPQRRYRR